jgi:hypothetical protein
MRLTFLNVLLHGGLLGARVEAGKLNGKFGHKQSRKERVDSKVVVMEIPIGLADGLMNGRQEGDS